MGTRMMMIMMKGGMMGGITSRLMYTGCISGAKAGYG
jgi:hypothetical protein